MKTNAWIVPAVEQLTTTWNSGGGWGYRLHSEPFVESTAVACLALLGCTDLPQDLTGRIREQVTGSAAWLAGLQQPDGSLGVSAQLDRPGWPTPWAVLIWKASGMYAAPVERAVDWLEARRGFAFEKKADSVVGHDTTIPGWPWVAGTHAWVEPSAMAVMALARTGRRRGRLQEGVRLLRDRALPTGGWNVGNTVVRGQTLRPQCAPTGLALLALAAAGVPADAIIESGCEYLESALSQTAAPASLCWGLLALRQWRTTPAWAEEQLQHSYEKVVRRGSEPIHVAHLLLAGAEHSLKTMLGTAREEVVGAG